MRNPRGPGQGTAVTAAMLAAGALIAQQVVGKATRDALFLSTFHVSSLPLVMIASAVASSVAVLGFSAALSRRSPAQVVPRALALGTVLVLAEWGLSLVEPRAAAVAVYLHMAAFGATVVSGFWSMVNERFDPYLARRVMGRIGVGASLGGVAGGLLAWSAAGVLPVSSMLALMAAFNVVCLLALGRLGPAGTPGADRSGAHDTGPLSGFRLLREVRYLRDLALFVALGAATEAMLDYILNARAAAAIAPGQPLLSFFALFHTAVGLLALLAQTTLSRPSLLGLGLAGTVALRPAAVVVAALVGLVDPRLWTALLARGAHGVLQNSLFRSGYELLFTPVAERRKRPTKAIVDVGFDRLGTIAGGLLTLLVVFALGGRGSTRTLFALAAACAIGAILVSRRLHHGYVLALEESLRSGVVRLDVADVRDSTTLVTLARTGAGLDRQALLREVAAARGGGAGPAPLPPAGDPVMQAIVELRSGQPEAVRRALHGPGAGDPALVGHLVPLLASNAVFLDVVRALRRFGPRIAGQLLDGLLDLRQDPAVRRRLARVLRGSPVQQAVDGLLKALADPRFDVRRESGLTLARITQREASLVIARAEVFAAVVRELETGAAGWTGEEDPLSVEDSSGDEGQGQRAQTPAERGLAHVFTLLSLAVEREPLQTAYWALLSEDVTLRGTALEYLENVLPDPVRRALWPQLGLRGPTLRPARPPQVVVQDLMRSSDTAGFGPDALKKILPRR
jgi:ATP:ADP antiporter, AAA family